MFYLFLSAPGPVGRPGIPRLSSGLDHPVRPCYVARLETRGTIQEDHTTLIASLPLGQAPAGVIDFAGIQRGFAGGWAPALLGLWAVGLPPPSSWLRLWASQLRTAGGLRPLPLGGRRGSLDLRCRLDANFLGRFVPLSWGPAPTDLLASALGLPASASGGLTPGARVGSWCLVAGGLPPPSSPR